MRQSDQPGSPYQEHSFYQDNDRVKFALETLGIGLWEVRLADNKVSWDARCRQLFGLSRSGDPTFDEALQFIHPEDRDGVFESIQSAINGAHEGRYDMQYRINGVDDGIERWARFSGRVYAAADGTASHLAGVAQDITDLVRARQQASEAEVLARLATDGAGVGSYSLDITTGIVIHSPTLKRLFTGTDGGRMERRDFVRHVHPEDQPIREAAHREALETGQLFYEVRVVWDDGSIHWMRTRGTYRYDAQGKPHVLSGIMEDITESKEARMAIEENERQLLASFRQAPVGIAMISGRNLTFRMVNEFYGRLVGRRPEELSGRPLLEALPELEGKGFDVLLQQVMDTQEPYISNEASVDLLRNGQIETRFVNFIYQAQRGMHNEVSGVMAVVTDVTDQVVSRQRIADSEAKFRSLVQEAPYATALYVGEQLIIDTANEAMIQLWGKTPAVIGTPLEQALPELDGQPFIGILQSIFRTGETYHARAAPVDLVIDGRLQRSWFNFTYKPLYDAQGSIFAILNMALDVTEEVIARRKLEETQAALVNAIDLAELGTWSLDIASGAVTVSQRMLDWFGLSGEEAALGEAVNSIIEQDRARVAAAISKACSPGAGIYSEEYTVVNQHTGQRRILHAQGKAVCDANGQPVRLDGTILDLTLQRQTQMALERLVQERTEELAATNEELQATNEELQSTNEELAEANEQLQHSNEELAQYAYVASHDLQEPLRKIRMFSDLLNSQPSLSEENKPMVDRISQSAGRMSMLIKDLLDFSRLLNAEALFQPVDLSAVVAAVTYDFELAISEKAAKVSVEPLPVVEAVSLQMNQLFYNLLSNALKFVPEERQPLIRISSRLLTAEEVQSFFPKPLSFSRYFRITVSDNGIGFDTKYAEQIFEVFKRLHGKDVYPGSGIGLALCRRIAGNHKGLLYASSTPGVGTDFHLILPEKHSPA